MAAEAEAQWEHGIVESIKYKAFPLKAQVEIEAQFRDHKQSKGDKKYRIFVYTDNLHREFNVDLKRMRMRESPYQKGDPTLPIRRRLGATAKLGHSHSEMVDITPQAEPVPDIPKDDAKDDGNHSDDDHPETHVFHEREYHASTPHRQKSVAPKFPNKHKHIRGEEAKPGLPIMVLSRNGKWRHCKLVEADLEAAEPRIRCHYEGYASKYDEWLLLSDKRVRHFDNAKISSVYSLRVVVVGSQGLPYDEVPHQIRNKKEGLYCELEVRFDTQQKKVRRFKTALWAEETPPEWGEVFEVEMQEMKLTSVLFTVMAHQHSEDDHPIGYARVHLEELWDQGMQTLSVPLSKKKTRDTGDTLGNILIEVECNVGVLSPLNTRSITERIAVSKKDLPHHTFEMTFGKRPLGFEAIGAPPLPGQATGDVIAQKVYPNLALHGLRRGDKILQINKHDVSDYDVTKVISLLRDTPMPLRIVFEAQTHKIVHSQMTELAGTKEFSKLIEGLQEQYGDDLEDKLADEITRHVAATHLATEHFDKRNKTIESLRVLSQNLPSIFFEGDAVVFQEAPAQPYQPGTIETTRKDGTKLRIKYMDEDGHFWKRWFPTQQVMKAMFAEQDSSARHARTQDDLIHSNSPAAKQELLRRMQHLKFLHHDA